MKLREKIIMSLFGCGNSLSTDIKQIPPWTKSKVLHYM